MLTVTQFTSRLTPKLHGTSLAKLGNIFDKMQEAAGTLLARIDPIDTIQRARIDNAIYDNIYNYSCPSDIKGLDKVIDMPPIGPRSFRDDIGATYSKEFSIRRQKNTLTIEDVGGVKTLKVSKCLTPPTLLSSLDVLDSTITVGGDVTSPVIDYLDYVSGMGSLSFGLSGVTGIGTITVNLPFAADLSKMEGLGSLFEWIKFPDATRLASIDLKWGTDSSNYWHKTITVPQGRTAFDSNAWDLCRHDWVSATKTGSPSSASTKYLQITINYSTGVPLTFVKLDSIVAALGVAFELVYYSQFIFRDAITGALKEAPTTGSDIIQLDPLATNIYMLEVQKLIVPDLQGKNMGSDIANIRYELEGDGRILRGTLVANRRGLYRDYIEQYPSQALPNQTDYYDFDDLNGYGGDGVGDGYAYDNDEPIN